MKNMVGVIRHLGSFETKRKCSLSILLAVLFSILVAFPTTLPAYEPQLIGPSDSVDVNEPFDLQVINAWTSKITWQWDPRLDCRQKDVDTLSCVLRHLDKDEVRAIVTASVSELNWQRSETILIEGRDSKRQKPIQSEKNKTIREMLDDLRRGPVDSDSLMGFFKRMGKEGISVRDLIAFKASVINSIQDPVAGKNMWEGDYGHIERELMFKRREEIKKAWEKAAIGYFEKNPDTPFIFKLDVGGWAKEEKEKMRFEGDIDFTVIMPTTEQAVIIRDLFESAIKFVFNLDMVAVDALATAQRFATDSVYKGSFGADWGEKDAVKRGKVWKIEFFGGQLQEIEATTTEKAYAFAILKNNVQKKLTGKDRLQEIMKEKLDPRSMYDMEPGISLEFLRHINEDVIHMDLATHEKIIKMAKYLDRSASDHADAMKDVKASLPEFTETDLSEKDKTLVEGVRKITEAKQGNDTPARTLYKILTIAEDIMGKDWLETPEESLRELGRRAEEIMKHNIAEGVKARQTMIDNKQRRNAQEADIERKRFLDDLTTEYGAFKRHGVPFPEEALAALKELSSYFERRMSRLPESEQKKLKELLDRARDNPEMTKIAFAIVQEAVKKVFTDPVGAMGALNNFLDTLDNKTIESLRTTGVIEWETTVVRDGKKETTKKTIVKIESIAKINQMLNDSVLGKIGQSTAFQAFNLVSEAKSYYDAVKTSGSWSEAFTNLSVEIFRRRTPVGGAFEAYEHGNYLRLGIEVVYAIFPPLAIPEGLTGMVMGAVEWGVGKIQEWRYEDMVNELYRGAKFEGSGSSWKITGLSYKCPSNGDMTITGRDEILGLPMKCGAVFQTLIPQIKEHPVLLQYQEMLDNSAVSSGRMGNFPFKWDVKGGKYGEQLLKIYRKKVDDVALEFFRGVIEQLEKAQAWASGKKLTDILLIERELGCAETLIKFNIGYFGGDRYLEDVKQLQAMVDNFGQLKKANESILAVKDRWKASEPQTETRKGFSKTPDNRLVEGGYVWVKGTFPECSIKSIEQKSNEARNLDGRIKNAVKTCQSEAEKIVGLDKVTDALLAPLVRPAICVSVYKDTNRFLADSCRKDYDMALADLKGQAEDKLSVFIKPSGLKTISGRDPVTLTADYIRKANSGRMRMQWNVSVTERDSKASYTLPPINDAASINLDPTKFKEGDVVTVTLSIMDINITNRQILREGSAKLPLTVSPSGELSVRLSAVPAEISETDGVSVCVTEPALKPFEPQNKYYFSWRFGIDGRYADAEWQAGNEIARCVNKASVAGLTGKTVSMKVTVRDDFGRTREAETRWVKVVDAAAKLKVSVTPERSNITNDQKLTFVVTVVPLKDSGRLTINGVIIAEGTTQVSIPASFQDNENWVTVDFVVTDEKGRRAETHATVYVTKKQPDACVYQYSEWSQCDERTKKQRRRVISKSPDKCVEKEKPLLEQACTSVTKEDEKERIERDRIEKEKAERERLDRERAALEEQKLKEEATRKTAERQRTVEEAAKKKEQQIKEQTGADLYITVSIPDNWEGVYEKRGVVLTRRPAVKKGPDGVEARVSGNLTITGPSAPYEIMTDQALKETVEKALLGLMLGEAAGSGYKAEVTSLNIGDYRGFIRQTTEIASRYQGTEYVDASYPHTGVAGSGMAITGKGDSQIQITYHAGGRGQGKGELDKGLWYDDMPFLRQQTAAAFNEAKAIIDSIKLSKDKKIAKYPYIGPKMDGSEVPTVKLAASKSGKLRKNEIISLTATVENVPSGEAPLTYKWSDNCAGKGSQATFQASQTGSQTATVSVSGPSGPLGNASLSFDVQDIRVILEESSGAGTIPMGRTLSFAAKVISGGAPAAGNFVYRWQAEPKVAFAPTEGPSASSKGTFGLPGKTKVWVVVLEKQGAVLSTVAESAQMEIDVVNPQLKLIANKSEPLVGEKVVITAHEEPKLDDNAVSFRWEISGDALNPGPEPHIPNNRSYSFAPKDNKPVTLTVHLKGKDRGDDLGSASLTVTPRSYAVSLGEPRYRESPPQIWQCDTQIGQAQKCGMVTLKPNQFAVHRDILIKATLTPRAASPQFRWSVDPPGSCGLPGAGDEIKLNCSNTGTYAVKVEVTNADNVKLGEASQTVTVSVSQEQLSSANKSKEAYDKLQQAKAFVQQGKLDEAIPLAEEAFKLDPKNAEAKSLADKWKKERDEVKQHITKLDQFLKDAKIPETEKELQAAQKLHPKYQPFVDAEKRLKDAKDKADKIKKEADTKQAQAKKLRAEGEALQGQNKLPEAVAKYKESLAYWPDKSLEEHIRKLESQIALNAQKKTSADRLWQEGISLYNQKKMNEALAKLKESLAQWQDQSRSDYVKKLEQERSLAQKLRDEGAALQQQGKLQDAVNKYKQSLTHWPNSELEKHIALVEAEMKKQQETQTKKASADRLWQEGTSLYNQKKMNEALAKFKESLAQWQDQSRSDYVRKIEQEMVTARKLRDEGAALQNQGKLLDAANKYKQSLTHWPNPDLEKHIALVEVEAKKQQESQTKKASADRLWNECVSLSSQGRNQDALSKCRESVSYWPDQSRADFVKKLETAVTTPPPQPQPSKPPVIAQDAPSGDSRPNGTYWELAETRKNDKSYGGGKTQELTDGRISFSVDRGVGYYEATGSWTAPPRTLIPGQTLSITFTLKNGKIRGTQSNQTRIHASFSTQALRDNEGKRQMDLFEHEGPGAKRSGTFSTSIPGSNSSGTLELEVHCGNGGDAGAALIYVYTWRKGTSPAPGQASSGSLFVDETRWRVDGHPTPWVFRSNGTVDAKDLWTGRWTRTGEGITVTITAKGVTDMFLVKFSPDGKSFTAYKNNAVYRNGIRISE
jgi:hypothetical protein